MSDKYLVFDLLRLYVMCGAVFLSALVLRVAWLRRGTGKAHPDRPHILTSLAYVGAMGLMAERRIEAMGHAPDWHLAVAVTVATCGLIGMLIRVRIRRPGKRDR
jgi:hypothetical protein